MRPALVGAIGGFAAAAALSAAYYLLFYPRIAPVEFGKLLDCKGQDSEYKDLDPAAFTYTIRITGTTDASGKPKLFDFRNPEVTTEVAAGTATPGSPTVFPQTTPTTKLDFKTKLSKKQSANIAIVLDDPTLTFMKDGAVWDPEPALHGNKLQSKMLCGLVVAQDRKSLTFVLHAPKKADTGTTSHVRPNIGLLVQDAGNANYSLPIFLDPDIENDGVYQN